MDKPPISRQLIVAYALPHLTHAVITLPMALFIPAFYAQDMALPLAGVGAAIAASRLLDLFVDPLMGLLSDRLKTRWGRRKPWIALGTPLMMLSTWALFVPPAKVSLDYVLWWSALLFFSFTLVDLPHKAWGAELSADYLERTRIAAWREGFGALGQVIFLAALSLMSLFGHGGNREQLLAVAALIVGSLPPLVTLCLARVPEFSEDRLAGPELRGWQGVRVVLRNRPFLRTLGTLMCLGSAVMIQSTLHKLVLTHVVGRPDLFALMILLEHLASLAAVPAWLAISRRIGKHRAVVLAAAWVGLWSLGFPLVQAGDTLFYMTLIILRGSSFAAIFMLSNSIAADVVDHDIVASGRQRTGLFFAIWGIAVKLAVAIGVVLATALPAAFGFDPTAGAQAPATVSWLLRIYGWLPSVIIALGVPLMWNFPIDHARQRQLRREIDARAPPAL